MNEIELIHEALLSYPKSDVSEPPSKDFLIYKVTGKNACHPQPEVRSGKSSGPERPIRFHSAWLLYEQAALELCVSQRIRSG